jgi:hypothetical protein
MSMKNCVVTIVSGNYLAYARTLGQSLADAGTGFDLRVLVVDRRTPRLEQAAREAGLHVTFAEDLQLPDRERLFYKYDIVELNTALKPTFLKLTFAEGYDHVVYLDPDIRVFAPLAPVLQALANADIVLTPHALAPAMDGLRPSDVDFLRTGAYNLGFIALKASGQAAALLDWWESRCLGMGFNDPAFGVFVDQKWIDLVPCYFASVHVLRHPGCNVAYWNLHEREVSHEGAAGYRVGGEPLVFFHFSGVVPADPRILSRHQTRHQLQAGSVLQALVQDYCRTLQQLGHQQYSAIPYGFGTLDNGSAITPTMRRALLVVPYQEQQPFAASSRLQQDLRAARIAQAGAAAAARPMNTLTFKHDDRRVRMINTLLRAALRIIGLERLLAILRYSALLTRETHLPAVLLKQPLELGHKLRR